MNLVYISKTKKIFSLFAVVIFLASSLFVCHTSLVRASSIPEHNFVQDDQIFDEAHHHSSNFCHSGKESLVNQDNLSTLLAKNSQPYNSVQQKLSSYFASNIPPHSFALARQRDGPFGFSENLFQSQTLGLSTIVKIE